MELGNVTGVLILDEPCNRLVTISRHVSLTDITKQRALLVKRTIFSNQYVNNPTDRNQKKYSMWNYVSVILNHYYVDDPNATDSWQASTFGNRFLSILLQIPDEPWSCLPWGEAPFWWMKQRGFINTFYLRFESGFRLSIISSSSVRCVYTQYTHAYMHASYTIPYHIVYHIIYHTKTFHIPCHIAYHAMACYIAYHAMPCHIAYLTIPHRIHHDAIPHDIAYHVMPHGIPHSMPQHAMPHSVPHDAMPRHTHGVEWM